MLMGNGSADNRARAFFKFLRGDRFLPVFARGGANIARCAVEVDEDDGFDF